MMKRLLLLTVSLFSLTALEAATRYTAPAARVAALRTTDNPVAVAAPAALRLPVAAAAVAAPAARGAVLAAHPAAAGGAGAVAAPSAAEVAHQEQQARNAAREERLAALALENTEKMTAAVAARAPLVAVDRAAAEAVPSLTLGSAAAVTLDMTKAEIRTLIDENKTTLVPAFIAAALVYITTVLEDSDLTLATASTWFLMSDSAVYVDEITETLKALLLYDDVEMNQELLGILRTLRTLNFSSADGSLRSMLSLNALAKTLDRSMKLLLNTKYSDAHGLTVRPFRASLRDIFEKRQDLDGEVRPVPEFLMTDAEKAVHDARIAAMLATQRAAAAEAARRPTTAAGRAAVSTASGAGLLAQLGRNI